MMKRGQSVRSALLPLFLLLLPLLSGCATIPYDYPRTLSTALYLPEATSMGKKIQAQAAAHPGASGFYLLASEEEAFLARVRWIDRAEKTLDLQYYIFSADLTGRFILDRIIAAAERGVRVRLLLDDWRQTAEMDRWLAMMENYPSVEVRIFNPFGGLRSNPLSRPLQAIFGPKRLQGRMHNKAFIVDNSVAILGGRNIADEYFGRSSEVNFSDIDIMAEGPIVRQVSAAFDDYWNCVLSVPLKALVPRQPTVDVLQRSRHDLEVQRESLKKSSYAFKVQESDRYFQKYVDAERTSFVWARGENLFDDPLKVIYSGDREPSTKMRRELRAFLQGAQSELLMTSPYLVPGKSGVQWFQKERDHGITVKIITNSLASTDSTVAEFGYIRYRKDFLRMGVELYELRPTPAPGGGETHGGIGGSSKGALHTKTIVLDGRAVFVGSFNLDLRSEKFDTQNGIVVYSPELAAQVAGIFTKDAAPTRSFQVTLWEMIVSCGLLQSRDERCAITGNPWLGSGAPFPGDSFTW